MSGSWLAALLSSVVGSRPAQQIACVGSSVSS